MHNKSTERFNIAVKIAASALALSASLTGANALADNHGSKHGYQNGYHDSYQNRSVHQNVIRVQIPIRDHGPENLPLGRLIRQHSNVDLDHYRLTAVVTRNGRFSNGYASLRTGHRKTGRYFLGSRSQTRIPAPSRADNTWRLRLGPGTQVRSITAVLEPRRHGYANKGYANNGYPHGDRSARRHDSHHRVTVSNDPWRGVAWLIAKAEDDRRAKKQNKRLKKTRIELARREAELERTREKLARVKARNKRPQEHAGNGHSSNGKSSNGKSSKGKSSRRHAENKAEQRNDRGRDGGRNAHGRDGERNARYVISGGKRSNRTDHS